MPNASQSERQTEDDRSSVEEVMLLLYKGRSKRKIASELFISENTVREYSRRLYKKLRIHSKEELVDLFETYSGNSTDH